MTYDSAREVELKRRSGYSWDLIFTIPDILVLNNGDIAVFTIFRGNEVIFTKGYADVTIAGQTITIEALPEETENKSGAYNWKLDGLIGGKKILLGSGNFILD
jgi:hypothetical protein